MNLYTIRANRVMIMERDAQLAQKISGERNSTIFLFTTCPSFQRRFILSVWLPNRQCDVIFSVFSLHRTEAELHRESVQPSHVKMFVFCLTYRKNHVRLACFHSTEKIIVHIGVLSVDRITSEI
jgi:hypothetical protein